MLLWLRREDCSLVIFQWDGVVRLEWIGRLVHRMALLGYQDHRDDTIRESRLAYSWMGGWGRMRWKWVDVLVIHDDNDSPFCLVRSDPGLGFGIAFGCI